jgi:hypothetical protein
MMSFRQFAKRLVLLAGLIALPVLSNAGDLGPVVPKAKAKASEKTECVEPVSVMRKNHMKFLLHQRDETLHEGIRDKKHSLVECINCHVTKDDKGEYPKFGENGYFCSSCHNYAGVNIDCFECHSQVPENAKEHMQTLNTATPYHHKELADNSSLSKDTLKVLTEGGKD